MNNALILVLIVFGLALTALAFFLLLSAAFNIWFAYHVWQENTKVDLEGIRGEVLRRMTRKDKADPAEEETPNFEGYSYYTDERGVSKLLPTEEVKALKEQDRLRIEQEDEDVDNWVMGVPEGTTWRSRNGRE